LRLHEVEFVHDHGEIVTRLGRLAEGEAFGVAGAVAQYCVPIVGTIAVTVSALNGIIFLWKIICGRGSGYPLVDCRTGRPVTLYDKIIC
jgi:hypothetical protein